MPIPTVTSGDLITASLMNQIIQRLNELEGASVPGGNATVPAVIGMSLSSARSTIIAPSTQLSLGFVIDAGGNAVDLSSASDLQKVVINQTPTAGSRVNAGVAVNLVVSGSTGSGSQPQPQPPKITGFTPLSVAAGQEVQILGENFALSRFQNEVSFDNVPAQPPSSASSPTSLFVTVPTNIPNAPTGPGELKVDVKVTTPNGSVTSVNGLGVLAPLAGPPLLITGVTPGIPTTGQDATITGSGFAATAAGNTVEFSTVSSPIVSVVAKSLTGDGKIVVTVPTNIVGVTAPGTIATVNFVVKVGAKKSPAFPTSVQVPLNA